MGLPMSLKDLPADLRPREKLLARGPAALSDAELLDFTTLARVFGYPPTVEAQDSAVSARGYRAMAGIPRLQFAHVDLLVRAFGSLQGLLAASATDLQQVEGIGAMWARHVREGLSQLAESTIADRLA